MAKSSTKCTECRRETDVNDAGMCLVCADGDAERDEALPPSAPPFEFASPDGPPEPDSHGMVPTESLEVDGENPNEMTEKMFGLLCKNIAKKGWLGGPIITDTNGVIADGEHRWRAAKEAGYDSVPVAQYDIDDDTRRLWRLELNKIRGTHDTDRDALEVDYLLRTDEHDDVLDLFDATGDDLDALLDRVRLDYIATPGYDYDPDPRVHFMDCVEGMREHVDDDSVDCVFTSPPYNVNINEGYQFYDKQQRTVNYDDGMEDDEFKTLLTDTFTELARVIKPGGHIFINFQNDIRDGTVTPPSWIADIMPVPWRSFIVWNKGTSATMNGRLGALGDGVYAMNWEPILHFTEEATPLTGKWGDHLGVWNIDASNQEHDHDTGLHPAPFPVALVKKAIETSTRPGNLILDPFLGSGTTAVAAIETDRDFIGFELDEAGAYKPIIERRITDAKRRRDAGVNTDDANDADE